MNTVNSSLIKTILHATCTSLHSLHPQTLLHHQLQITTTPNQATISIPRYSIKITAQQWHVLSIGKIAGTFTRALADLFEKHKLPLHGHVIIPPKYPLPPLPTTIKTHVTSHPFPTQAAINAANTVIRFLQEIPKKHALIIFISGGGSAALEKPIPPLTINDLLAINNALLDLGIGIQDINTIRTRISQVKGGKLLKHLTTKNTIALLYSDVPQDNPQTIASGPFYPPKKPTSIPSDTQNKLFKRLPPSLTTKLRQILTITKNTQNLPTPPPHIILASNTILRKTIHTLLHNNPLPVYNHPTDITMTPDQFKKLLSSITASRPNHILLFGGEITPPITTTPGPGGRCTHTALTLALQYPNHTILAIATDGVDGTSKSSGAIIPAHTFITNTKKEQAQHALTTFTTAAFLKKHHMLLPQTPTGLNFMDLYILIPPPSPLPTTITATPFSHTLLCKK